MTPATLYQSILRMSPTELESFRSQLRRRYSREQLIAELRECAARQGTSPTMREFAADPETTVHPQTLVEHFGSWNEAKREAGLLPRRMATRSELIRALQELGHELGGTPTAKDIVAAKGRVPSKNVYINTFGSIQQALQEAGFDSPDRDERLERSIEFAAVHLLRTGQLPTFRDWERLRGPRTDLLTAWQLYRAFTTSPGVGAWSAFQSAASRHAEARTAA